LTGYTSANNAYSEDNLTFDGTTLGISAGTVGTTAGNQKLAQRITTSTTNADYLEITNTRVSNGSDWQSAGYRIQQKVDATWMAYIQFNGDNNGGVSIGTGTTTTSATTISERVRITSGGNVGIGTVSPGSYMLNVVQAASANTVNITRVSGYANIYGTNDLVLETDSTFYMGAYTARPIYFNSANGASGTVYIASDGKVGIGTTSPGYKLEVSGNAKVTGELVIAKSGTDSTITFPAQTNDPGFITHYESDNAARMYFSVSDDDNITGDYFAFGAGGTYRTFIYTNGRIDAAILYDYNNTGYYLDPASTSNLNVVRTQQVLTPNHSLSSVYGSFNTTTTNGYLITTNISYNVFNMPTVIIEGYAYGGSQSINLQIVWYAYNDSFINKSYVNNGDWDPGTIRIGENGSGKVCIHLSSNIYYGRFNVRCIYDQGFAPLEGWSITDATYTGLSRLETIGKSAINTSITGNADTVDTFHASVGNNANYIVVRDGSGDIFFRYSFSSYVNTTDNDVDGITRFVVKNGDNYHRSATPTLVANTIRGVASGDWSINITGTAASETLQTVTNRGNTTTNNIYAPIFYDNNDSAYYLNPNGTSNINAVNVNWINTQNGYWYFNDTNRDITDAIYYPNAWARGVRFSFATADNTATGGTYSGVLHFHPWDGTSVSTGDASYQLVFGSTAVNGSGYPQLVIRNGIDTTWNSWYYIPMYGLNQYAGALYATIYYDADNTAYYLNPSGSSRLGITITTTTYFGSTTSHGYAEEYGTYSSSLRRIAFMSFDWNANYNSYNYHGIASTDLNGTFTDNMSINSFNDINLRIDSNNNNGASYVRFHNNSDVANQFAYIGYDGTNYLSYFTGTGYFTGDVIAYYSDARLKENVRPIDSVIEKISKIGGYYYTPNALALQLNAASDNNQKLGVLAQEIEKVFPEAVEKAPFDRDENGNSKSGEDYLTVKYERLVPVLIEAIKEQQKQIEELKYLIKNK